jgi:hypothetical protein
VSSSSTNTPLLDGVSTTMLHATTSSISVPDYDEITIAPPGDPPYSIDLSLTWLSSLVSSLNLK